MTGELKKCPFCGGDACLEKISRKTSYFEVYCSDCGATMCNEYESGVIEAWDRRTI